ncbi:hypothetical protein [Chryseobacterium caseinilyticum]|uniref:Toxin-antitoxin system YwqK family antitoxin n=1 Tax=Chryseobacterium caseinilyticum TaxID=2771428 RepID=A0ABR8ZI62_9FLAO|nr:hypothetical protein [Chryseobacterium caseinilyticum]MBD8084431.1 hypothetical protein [Chryseobacterium caseinilyticum]
MKFQILFILLFIFNNGNAQNIVSDDAVYFKEGIAYQKSNSSKFSGTLQLKKKNGHVKSETTYDNGKQNEFVVYYNLDEKQMVCDRFFYESQTGKKKKHLRYSLDGLNYSETEFDENEDKKSYRFYKNNKLTIYKEFQNNKKHGTWFCINEDGSKSEIEYFAGKKVEKKK